MFEIIRECGKVVSSTLALLILIAAIPFQAFAQPDIEDWEAPVIEHDPLRYSADDVIQIFNATVADNIAVSKVELFYRYAGQQNYQSLTMRPLLLSSEYSASISTVSAPGTTIEYYLQAEDQAGNIVLEGYAFAPIARALSLPETAGASASSAPEQETLTPATDGKTTNPLWYVLGALVVAGLAAGLSGGGSTDGGPTPIEDGGGNCSDAGCLVTFTITPP